MLTMRRLLPDPAAEVAAVEEYAARPGLRANMVSSVDGAATLGGRVGDLTGSADQDLLELLRSLTDVLLIGAGTVRAEGYGPLRALPELADVRREHGQTPHPRLAVVSRRLDLDLSAPAFVDQPEPPILLTVDAAPADRVAAARAVAEVVVAGATEVDPAVARDELAARGLTRMLSEGGPEMLASLVRADAVDELCLALAPTLVAGSESRILRGEPFATPVPLTLAAALERDGYLFLRYRR